MGVPQWHVTDRRSPRRATARASPNANKGKRFFADTLTREEINLLLDECNCGAEACATAR
jgi:hypothetical protein